MAVNVQKPHEVAPLIDAQPCKLRAPSCSAQRCAARRVRPRRSVFASGARSSPRRSAERFQVLSAKLGIVTGRNLAEMCRHIPR
jgi:hypothetical protein